MLGDAHFMPTARVYYFRALRAPPLIFAKIFEIDCEFSAKRPARTPPLSPVPGSHLPTDLHADDTMRGP
jgi:hypothetical protein